MKKGFTLIELIIFMAIFAVVVASFMAIFISVINVNSSQTAVSEVGQQGQLALQQLQYTISSARSVDMTQDVATSTLELRQADSIIDPTIVYALNGILYLKQGTALVQPLTSSKVYLSQVSFTRHYNTNTSTAPYGTDSVSFSFTLTASSTNNKQYTQTFQSAVALIAPVPKIDLLQQAQTVADPNNTGISLAYPTNNESGSLLLAVVSALGATNTIALSDTAGNAWTEIASTSYGSSHKLALFDVVNAKSGPNTIHATTTNISGGGYYPNGYLYRRSITIATTTGMTPSGTALTNFPMYLYLQNKDFAFAGNGGKLQNSNGDDLIFTADASGTIPLAYERDGSWGGAYNNFVGSGAYYVKIPTLSSSSNVIYVFYNNPSINSDQSDAAAVWSNGYADVYHMTDDASNYTVYDSTGNAPGTSQNLTDTRQGSLTPDGGLHFDGSTDYITMAREVQDDMTLCLWFHGINAGVGSGLQHNQTVSLITSEEPGLANDFGMGIDSNGDLAFGTGGGSDVTFASSKVVSDNNYHYGCATRAASTGAINIYVDGHSDGGGTANAGYSLNANSNIKIGDQDDSPHALFTGDIEGVEISNVVRSSDWIATEDAEGGGGILTFLGPATTVGGVDSVFIYEYRGAATSSSFDVSSTQTRVIGLNPSSGNAMPTSTVELLFGIGYNGSTTDVPSAGTGYTLETSSTLSQTYVEDMNQYVTGPVAATWRYAVSADSTVVIATFQ